MSNSREANKLIHELVSRGFYATCPSCQKSFLLRNAGLFFMDEFTPEAKVLLEEKLGEMKASAKALRDREKDIPKRSEIASEATNIGVVLEQIAPTMKTFPFSCNDCRSLFKPIDYVVFDGMCKKNEVDKVFFIDIKTGNAHLTRSESAVRHAVKEKHVLWDTYDSEAIT